MQKIPLPHPRLRRALERLSDLISEPLDKLRFIKHTLEGFDSKPSWLRETPIVRGWTLYYSAVESFARLARRPGPRTFPAQPYLFLYQARYVVLSVVIVFTVIAGYGMGRAAYRAGELGWVYVADLYTPPPIMAVPAAQKRTRPAALTVSRANSFPEEVWLVETEDEGELWSNGLRISTTYESRTQRRNYVLFPRSDALPVEFRDQPIGIVFHTSEYDIAPFRSGFNQEILRTSRSLLRWIARRELYNYFIDRFGQVYRLVADGHIASHAGVSIWADDEYVYLNLSDSFLGVCFESRWSPQAHGQDILTPAQIQSGLNLTDMLRARYGISDTNCVPHGLVSVNPKKMLIGYHTDWAKGFPFSALGLSDKYEVPLPSVTEFGFGYDEHLLQTLDGRMWPGVRLAEVELARRAEHDEISIGVLRKNLRRRYRQQLELLKLAQIEKSKMAGDP